ncbi:hypothetical protein Pla110_07920 [Polystyrenella longa]|uniref:Tll0287-like domain-containing protein n=1 Tax=Polystyrenella longa TaxID=2528007 RepID=A0A518CIM8_9PLAN|nr:DUF3365 domain-containing protein [Polystyrenella longa]QDU79088.1 hypothetical protein Pla110_07920 [Polystyrenella longa]
MKKLLAVSLLLLLLAFSVNGIGEEPAADVAEESVSLPATVEEARGRAKLLHEMAHGALQVMHRDFFLEDESRVIPSASLEDVFEAINESYQVRMKWLIVETDIVNVDHEPATDYERTAAKALAEGKGFFEQADANQYSYTGSIRLASQCLKCHVQDRKDTEPRTAGLVIQMPLNQMAVKAVSKSELTTEAASE